MLSIKDLTIEYSSGGYVVRPIYEPRRSRPAIGSARAAPRVRAAAARRRCSRCIAGLLTPASGSDPSSTPKSSGSRQCALTEYRLHTVGVVFQAFNLLPSLTAVENVAVPLRAAGWSKAEGARAGRRAARQRRPLGAGASPPRRHVRRPAAARRHRVRCSRTTRPCSSPTNRRRTSTTSRSRACIAAAAHPRRPVASSSSPPTTTDSSRWPTPSSTSRRAAATEEREPERVRARGR